MREPVVLDLAQLPREGKPRVYEEFCCTIQARDFKEPKYVLELGKFESTYQDTWVKGESNGMKVNSFFCGAGGFDLGFIQAGFEIAGAWDFDKYAVQSYEHNIGDHVHQADVSKMIGEHIPKANGWLFGFPCQDISIAGKQAGMIKGETRSGLFYEIMRLLGEVSDKPEWILAENVKAVNKFIPTIEEEYDKAGYTLVSPQLYNTKFWFLPQNRERYFLLGIRKDLAKSFVFPEQQTDYIPKLSSVLESEVDEKYYIDDLKAAKIIEQAIGRLQEVHASYSAEGVGTYNPKKEDGTQTYQQDRVYDVQGVSPAVSAELGGRMNILEQPKIEMVGLLDMKGNETVRRVYDPQGLSPTLTTSEGGHRQPKIIEHFRVRKLTPREYARLQGFPETYEQVVSNSQFYKQMGNAVSVNVAYAIAKAIGEQL